MKVFCTVLIIFIAGRLFAQVAINGDGVLCDSSAILDIKSTIKGLLIPRMSEEERDAIIRPANGLLIFCTDNNRLYVNRGTSENKNWAVVADAGLLQDSINNCYRKSDTSGVLLSRQRAALEYEPVISEGAATEYWNGHKEWTTLNTSNVPEGSANLYFTPERVRNTSLAGLAVSDDTIMAADSVVSAIGKLQGQISGKENLLSFNVPLNRAMNNISLPPSSSLNDGYLTSSDWTAFYSKQNALAYIPENEANKSANPGLGESDDLYPTQNAVKTYVNGLSGNYIANSGNLQPASFHITGNGWLQNGNIGIGTMAAPAFQLDINGTFNVIRIQTLPVNYSNTSVLVVDDFTGVVSKRTNSFSSGTVQSVTASPPLSSTGGTAPNISMTQATASVNGYLSSPDWNLFNGKENTLTFNQPLSRAGNSISLLAASGSQNGYLSNSDYTRLHGSAGSVLFYDATGIQQDNSSLYFDNPNNRLGIGTTNPLASLSVGASSQFQVASDGHCTVTGSFGSTSSITGLNTNGTGVSGTGSVYGIYGQTTIGTGERAGGYFYASANAYARVGGYKQLSPGVYDAYLIWGVGKLVTQNKSSDGSILDLVCPVSPEPVITDYGTGKLINGKCHIDIDAAISKRILVNEKHSIKVFIQLEDDCKGVYVTNKSAGGFDVVELMDGSSDADFSYSISANVNDENISIASPAHKNREVRSAEYRIRE